MSFPCPDCGVEIKERPDRIFLRCVGCGARLSGRSIETDGKNPAFEVRVVGRPDLVRRVEVPWDGVEARRLSAWLLMASAVTLGLVVVLFVAARMF